LSAGPDAGEAAGVLAARGRGELTAAMALARIIVACRDVRPARRALREAVTGGGPAAACARELEELLDANAAGVERAAAMLASDLDTGEAGGSVEDGIARCARLFDWAVGVDPAASVALYSLGDEGLLAAATAEAVALMRELGVAAPGRDLLDLGCGTGRFAAAVAPVVASVTGVDASAEMVRVARERCAGLPNVRLLQTDGRDLAAFEGESFDAVIAVDSFPYLYRAGGPAFAEATLAEVARVVRAGGDALVMNLSYRGDPALDRADAAAFAWRLGLELRKCGTRDLRSWDGATFHFRKAGR
jgi:SAM-dependent methyltransferase